MHYTCNIVQVGTYTTAPELAVVHVTPYHEQGLVFVNQFVLVVHPGPNVELYKSTSACRSGMEQFGYWFTQFVMQFRDHVAEDAGNRADRTLGTVPVN